MRIKIIIFNNRISKSALINTKALIKKIAKTRKLIDPRTIGAKVKILLDFLLEISSIFLPPH